VDNNLDFNFSELDFSRVTVYSGLTFKSIRGQIGRLFDEFKRELGRVEGIDAVEFNNSVLEEMEFHVSMLMTVSTNIH